MEVFQFKNIRTNSDGRIDLKLHTGFKNSTVEVIVIYEPVKSKANHFKLNGKINKSNNFDMEEE